MYSDFTFSIIKPNAVRTGKTGPILAMINEGGFEIAAMRMVKMTLPQAESFYSVHKGKPFYDGLISYITSAPVMAMVWEGPNAVAAVRQTVGTTKPAESAPGTIRHDYALEVGRNLIHASDKPETGEREVALWFKKEELVDWKRAVDQWVFEK